jgi:tRNA (guanine10-N2)-dimethyltransferase
VEKKALLVSRTDHLDGSMFVLSGEDLSLPFGEIRALVDTYARGSPVFQSENNRRIVFSSVADSSIVAKIASRSAYCRFGGKIVGRSAKLESLSQNIQKSDAGIARSFAVDSLTVNNEIQGQLGESVKQRTRMKVNLERPDEVFQLENVGPEYVLAHSTVGYKQFSWKSRRPRARRFFLPSAVYPKLARVLVNLSRVKEGQTFLDPFCGTGSLLIESTLMGLRSIGIDLKRWIARGSMLNLKHFGLDFESIIRADSANHLLPFRQIDAIATDVPYGRASSTLGRTTKSILEKFLDSASSALAPDHCLVVMHPKSIDLAVEPETYELLEQHSFRVHRSLTRAVSVLKRK